LPHPTNADLPSNPSLWRRLSCSLEAMERGGDSGCKTSLLCREVPILKSKSFWAYL